MKLDYDIKHVVWDWNGTLFHDAVVIREITSESFEQLGFGAVSVEKYQQSFTHPIQMFYERLILFYERLICRPIQSDEMAKLNCLFYELYGKREHQLGLAPGAHEAIKHWQTIGFTQSVLSLHAHELLQDALAKFALTEFFFRVDGRLGEVPGEKTESLKAHLSAMKISSSVTLVVGDTVDDARAARNVGAQCILLASGLHSRQALESMGIPVIDSLDELLEIDRPMSTVD